LILVLACDFANAEPQRDISQLDPRSARQSLTVSSFEIKLLPALRHSNGVGILAGGQVVQFLNETFFFGGGGFGGTLVGRREQSGGFGYGGFIAGGEARVGDKMSFDVTVLTGGPDRLGR
jgi:hypothetical protein